MSSTVPRSAPSVLPGPVRVVMQRKDECVDDRRLEAFKVGDGPATREIRLILENLISGEANPQTLALLEHGDDAALIGIASVRIDGNAQLRGKSSTPWFLRRLAGSPYVNLIARDERYRNHVLRDGRTTLGEALVRAALEVVGAEQGAPELPTVWALVQRENLASKRAFARFAFYPHDRSGENQQDVLVRRAGRDLPAPLEAGAYRPAEWAAPARDKSSEQRR
jgi:hypothetical protein